MSNNVPLTDGDRWDWLIALRQESVAALRKGPPAVVMTCSALKRKYRDVIRVASYNDNHLLLHFIYLHTSPEILFHRLKERKGHYMKESMLASQVHSLETPSPDEADVCTIDVGRPQVEVRDSAIALVRQNLHRATRASCS